VTATNLELSSDTRVGTQAVYVKQLWADEWTFVPGLEWMGGTWSCFPSIGQATLWRPFGLGMYPGDAGASYKAKLSIDNYFVKAVYTFVDGSSPLEWYGVVACEERHRQERATDPNTGLTNLSGEQVFHCHELGYLLDRVPIVNGWFESVSGALEIGAAPAFNHRGVPNRAPVAGAECFNFSKYAGEDYSDYWSSRDIVEYLLFHFRPQLGTETGEAFAITIENPEDLPDWDKPEIVVHGATLWEALSRVLDRRRGIGGYFYSSGSAVILKVYTLTDTELALGGEEGETLAANPNQYNLLVDHRPDFGTSLKLSMADQYDRVVLEGRRRRAVCTLKMADVSEHILADWTDDEETKYDNGATLQAGFGALDETMKAAANADVRGSPQFHHVYARFRVNDDFEFNWNGKTAGGTAEEDKPVFVDDEDPTKVYGNWPSGWRLLQSLPLYVGVDYSGTTIEDGELPEVVDSETPVMPTMCFFPTIEDDQKWFEASSNALSNVSTADDERRWSLRVRVEDERPRFWLDVIGNHQHQIAAGDFVAVDGDEDMPNKYDWRDALVTLCFEENRQARAEWPTSLPGAGVEIGAIRVKHLDIGDGFCQDYVTPQTVVGISYESGSTLGELLRSESGGFVRDDTPKMRAMASQLYDYYKKVRKVLRIEKVGLASELWLGDYITQLGAAEDAAELVESIGTVVTQISVSFPAGNASSPPEPPRMIWETAQGELDALIVPVRRRA
jgi:hypothetical protein